MKEPTAEQFAELWCYLWAALEISDKPAQAMAALLFADGTINPELPLPVWEQWENSGKPTPHHTTPKMSRTIRAYQLLQGTYAAKRCEKPAGRAQILQQIDAREQAWQNRAEILPILRR